MTPNEQYGDMLSFSNVVFLGGGIPLLCEIPEWLYELENVVIINWVKFHFCENYPFKKHQYSTKLPVNQTWYLIDSVRYLPVSNNRDLHITEHHKC